MEAIRVAFQNKKIYEAERKFIVDYINTKTDSLRFLSLTTY